MAPKYQRSTNADAWWQNAYAGRTDMTVEFEMTHGKDVIVPGTKIKFKNDRGTYKFRCLAELNGEKWIDCLDIINGTWRSFHLDKFKCVVKMKRYRKKKSNV